jgi:DNA-binding transcriptional MerR regulator/methanogenic corrinoid protein MtbC1
MSEDLKLPQMFTIGALSRATGVPPDTLRTWERRYGFPKPERTDTGHRRYSQATLERLRLVREALQLGHRAANIIHAEISTLRGLVEEGRNQEASETEPAIGLRVVERWIELIRRFDGRGFERELRASLATLGVPSFLALRAAPFVQALGDRWADGLLGVRHEHFASERLGEFFIRQWRPLSDACSGPAVVCATPAGERHALGLQMAAFTLALNNVRVVYLGADLPAQEVAEAVTQHAARAVVLSSALGSDRTRLTGECDTLRAALGPEFPIIAGGAGFSGIPSVTVFEDFQLLERWVASFTAALV